MSSFPRNALRFLFRQRRHVWQSKRRMYVELRSRSVENPEFLSEVEQVISRLPAVGWVRYVPILERLVIEVEGGAITDTEVVKRIRSIEKKYGYARSPFVYGSGFPHSNDPIFRAIAEISGDVGGLVLGLLLRRGTNQQARVWIDVSAVAVLVDNIPELRDALDTWLGHENADFVINLLSSFSEGMLRGWSGTFLDTLHRVHELSGFLQKRRLWDDIEENLIEVLLASDDVRGSRPARPTPLPPGAIERYQETAEQLSLAGFGVSMANTHDLTSAVAALFAAIPKPATMGRETFIVELERLLSRQGVFIVDVGAFRLLDRINCLLIEARWIDRKRHVVSATKFFVDRHDMVRHIETLLRLGGDTLLAEGNRYRLTSVAHDTEIPGIVQPWWNERNAPVAALRLLWENDVLAAAAIINTALDGTLEVLIARAHAAGLQVAIIGADKETLQWMRPDYSYSEGASPAFCISDLQQRGLCVMAVGAGQYIEAADFRVGVLSASAGWPAGAHIVAPDWRDALWLLLGAIESARKVAEQGVELAKIDAFAGLVLSLGSMDVPTIKRIKMATNAAGFLSMLNGLRLARKLKPFPEALKVDPVPWHSLEVDTAIFRLGSSWEGLSDDEAVKRLNGFIKAPESQASHFLRVWLEEMSSPLVPVLFAGAGLSALTGAIGDALLIGAVTGFNAFIGGYQRVRTENQLDELYRNEQRKVRCMRGGSEVLLLTEHLVPGDVIALQAGEVVPADARILSSRHLEIDESSLTGESIPVAKHARPCQSALLDERTSMLFEGTTVSAGEVHAMVVARQEQSEARRLFFIQHPRSAASGVEARLEKLTDLTAPVAAFAGISVMLSGLVRNQPVAEVVGAGVSLAVAAVPEGLPLMSTMAQLASAGRLSKRGAVVRNPRAIEALGRMNVLCADKTGTLTEGRLVLKAIAVDGQTLAIESLSDSARQVLMTGLLASPVDANDLPHMTDAAVVEGARLHHPDLLQAASGWQRLHEMPFRSETGYHATLSRRDNVMRVAIKGAPEVVVQLCDRWLMPDGSVVPFSDESRKAINETSAYLARRGYRVLAVADKTTRHDTLDESRIRKLVFRGYLAVTDPIRSTAKSAIDALQRAGIQVKMITGDHPLTAAAIAEELEMTEAGTVLTGGEIDQLSDDELGDRLPVTGVFARVTPRQKARIVSVLQKKGLTVGMTGDGANDAPAIRLADVGIALGERATAAARTAADLLVVDGRIETIVQALLEGRALWASVRDAVALLVGGNLGEIGFTLLGGLLDGRSPLNARQLLLVNLLTDTLPALAVALRRPKNSRPEDLMQEGPEASLGRALTREIEWRAGITTSISAASWLLARATLSPAEASTVALMGVVGCQLGQTLIVGNGSREVVVSSVGALVLTGLIIQTPGLSRVFGCTPLSLAGWAQTLGTMTVSLFGSKLMPVVQRELARYSGAIEERLMQFLEEHEFDESEALLQLAGPELPLWSAEEA